MIDLFLRQRTTSISFQSHDDSNQLEVTVAHPDEPRDRTASFGDAVALNVKQTNPDQSVDFYWIILNHEHVWKSWQGVFLIYIHILVFADHAS
jgi:hypothetical protein